MKRGHVNGVPSFCCMLDATNFFQLLPLDLVKLPYTICGAVVFFVNSQHFVDNIGAKSVR